MEERQRIAKHEVLRRVNADAQRHGYRAALEAVFGRAAGADACPPPRSSRHVVPSAPADRPAKNALLGRLLEVEGRAEISRAATAYFAAGFELPLDQAALTKLLEHEDEAIVRDALGALDRVLATQPAPRRMILHTRVRRLEDQAEELATRDLAARVRRRLAGSTLRLETR
jgi:hypothetical protein